jgi:TonB family protein
LGNDGIGYDLSGRNMIKRPIIQDKSQETGKVAVNIKVDKNGNVTYAKYTSQGSTTTDAHLIQLAEKAAREAKFNADPKANVEAVGKITFNFTVR